MSRHILLGLLALSALVALGGCRRRGARDARRVQRYEQNLVRIAARDTGCSPMQVQPVRIADRVWTANTCVGPVEYDLYCRSQRRRWANCSWRRIATVAETAQSVLMCPPQAVQQQVTNQPMVRFASGCGRQVQMNLACSQAGCGWMAAGPPTGAPAQGANVVIVPAQ